MIKLNAILDETTIISFPFYSKLLLRYYFISILVPVFIFSYSAFFYINQKSIYISSMNVSIIKSSKSDSTKAIASLMGESMEGLRASDVILMTKSRDFLMMVADKVYNLPDYERLILDKLASKKPIRAGKMFKDCRNNSQCIIKKLSYTVSDFITLKPNSVVDDLFTLEVKTLDRNTTTALLLIFKDSMLETRIKALSSSITKQKEVIEKLIADKEASLSDISVDNIGRVAQQKRDDLGILEKKIVRLENDLQAQKAKLELIQSQLEQTKKVIKKKLSVDDIAAVEQIETLTKEVKNLQQDIQALELYAENMTTDDKIILSELRAELKVKQSKLGQLTRNSNYSLNETTFLTRKNKGSQDIEFQAKVAKSQVKKIEKRLIKLKSQRVLLREEIKLDTKKLDDYKPILEQMKLLKNKLLQVNLLESTITADLSFDKEMSSLRRFKRTTKVKVILFASFITFFSVFLFITVRYLFDPRIYDEYELQRNFQDLDVIGKTPDFK
jgi:hypothetical protein